MLYDYIIVGAGIAGSSLAYQVAKGHRVLMLEQESQPGYHSTGRSAALYLETYGTPTIRALTVAGYEFYKNPPSGFTDQPILTLRGALYLARTDEKDLLDQTYQEFLDQNLEVQVLTPEQAVAMVPCLKQDLIVGAVYDQHASDLNVHSLHQGYLRSAQKDGAELKLNASLSSATWDGTNWTVTIKGETQEIRARAIVNAAGAWADTVAVACGVKPLGVQPKRRSAFLFEPPQGVDHRKWPAVMPVDESFYFKPDAGMLMGSPANADPVDPHDVVAEELDIATGIYNIESMTNLQIRRPSHTWAGLRSFAPDDEFVIGWDTNVPSFFWLAGQGGYGIQTAAGASLLAASLLTHQEIPSDLLNLSIDSKVVSPSRFD